MYKTVDHSQHSFFDFNQPMGLHMNPENRWIKMADSIPWDVFEKKYAKKFKSRTGNVAKPLCMALGARIVQKKYNYSDRELIEQLTENPYYQYSIGLPGFQEEPPFDASTLVLFRKRLDEQIIMEANNYMQCSLRQRRKRIWITKMMIRILLPIPDLQEQKRNPVKQRMKRSIPEL